MTEDPWEMKPKKIGFHLDKYTRACGYFVVAATSTILPWLKPVPHLWWLWELAGLWFFYCGLARCFDWPIFFDSWHIKL